MSDKWTVHPAAAEHHRVFKALVNHFGKDRVHVYVQAGKKGGLLPADRPAFSIDLTVADAAELLELTPRTPG